MQFSSQQATKVAVSISEAQSASAQQLAVEVSWYDAMLHHS